MKKVGSCRSVLWISSVIIVFFVMISEVMTLPPITKIGGLIETSDDQQEIVLRTVIKMINSDDSLLPPRKQLRATVTRIAPQDSYRVSASVCRFLEDGIAAIIAPRSLHNLAMAQSISDTFEIPLLQTHWAPRIKDHSHTINIFPESKNLARAFSEFFKENNWKSFSLIFDENPALIRLQEILQVTKTSDTVKMKVNLRNVIMDEDDLSKFMKDFKKAGINNFVVDLPLDRVKQLFAAAQKVDMMTVYQSYFLTSMDVNTVEWNEEYIGLSNITSFRLIDPDNPKFKTLLSEWITSEKTQGHDVQNKQPIMTESALLFDAIGMLTKTLVNLDRAKEIDIEPLYCDDTEAWPQGSAIVDHMRNTHFYGTSGIIKIGEDGLRTDFTIDVVKVTTKGVIKTGSWDNVKGFQKSGLDSEIAAAKDLLKHRTLRVTTGIAEPYVMKDDNALSEDKDIFRGFCVDLLDILATKLGFNYTIAVARDGEYGDDKSGSWNGMIGELLRREADIAITDLSIIYRRESVVDFTMPFMNLGISILYKKPEKKPPAMFSFLKPLSLEVWFYMGTGYLGVSLLLYILARLSPYEWVNPHPCKEDNDVVENQFTLLNSFWFTIGSIMQQGSDILPRAISTRIVASSWWFFTLIMISSYTANLAAFLTAQRMASPIESVEDLAKQTTIQYGCKDGGSTKIFFQDSKYPTYQRMWSFMESTKPSVFTHTNDEGIDRVKLGNYAYLMESSSIEYMTERHCDLAKIGSNLDSKGYGIATPPGSPYRSVLSSGILELQENQQLQILKDKWWKAVKKCSDDSSATSAEMGIRNVGGVFMVLGIGSFLGAVIVIIEFVWKTKKILNRDPIRVIIWRQLKSTLMCSGSTRLGFKEDDQPSIGRTYMVNKSKKEGNTFS